MKLNLLFSLYLTLLLTGSVLAQSPEKIYGKNYVLKSNEYYLEQTQLWKKETVKNPANTDAWYNYYRADRNAYIVGEETDSLNTKGINRFSRLEKTVQQMEQYVPNSFEYNYVKWLNGNNDLSLFPYLEKAHLLAPGRTEPLMSMVYYYEVKGDYALRDKYAMMYYKSGEFSPGILNYGYNMLSGLEKDAIIFTEGDKDTDAGLLLQCGKAIRTDVRLLNLNLLLNTGYRERVFKELDIPALNINPLTSTEDYEKYRAVIIEQFTKNSRKRPVYTATTVTLPYTKTISEKLSLTGLAKRYSVTKADSITVIKKNIEEVYALDYLTVYFANDISVGMMYKLNKNYLTALAALTSYYLQLGDNAKAAHYKNLAHTIALNAEALDEYQLMFGAD